MERLDSNDEEIVEDPSQIISSSPTPQNSTTSTRVTFPYIAYGIDTMATTSQVFIDGSFVDLADELAGYIDNVTKAEESKSVRAELKSLLAANKKDDALKKLVTASPALNAAPEKEFTAAYNLLVYLVIQSPNVNIFLPKICENLSRPIVSSPNNGAGLALSVLTTLFNLLKEDNEVRYHVFEAILKSVKQSGLFEMLRPELKKLDEWFQKWETDEEDQRKLLVQIADVAEDAGEDEYVTHYLATNCTVPHLKPYTNMSLAVNHTSTFSVLCAPTMPLIPLPSPPQRPPPSLFAP